MPCVTPVAFKLKFYAVINLNSEEFCELQNPVEEWPICDCLISFHSKGFPLDKAIQYEKLRKPYVINNLHMQYDIQVYGCLF